MNKFTIKTLLTALLLVAVVFSYNKSDAQGLTGKYINFPDTNFIKTLIKAGVDKDSNGKIDTLEALSITNLNIANSNIKKFIGIEYFKNLDSLNCSNNVFDTIDLSNNSKLIYEHL